MWFMRCAGGYWRTDHSRQELILFNILHERVEYETHLELMDQSRIAERSYQEIPKVRRTRAYNRWKE
jgi:hypothetical protein